MQSKLLTAMKEKVSPWVLSTTHKVGSRVKVDGQTEEAITNIRKFEILMTGSEKYTTFGADLFKVGAFVTNTILGTGYFGARLNV